MWFDQDLFDSKESINVIDENDKAFREGTERCKRSRGFKLSK